MNLLIYSWFVYCKRLLKTVEIMEIRLYFLVLSLDYMLCKLTYSHVYDLSLNFLEFLLMKCQKCTASNQTQIIARVYDLTLTLFDRCFDFHCIILYLKMTILYGILYY